MPRRLLPACVVALSTWLPLSGPAVAAQRTPETGKAPSSSARPTNERPVAPVKPESHAGAAPAAETSPANDASPKGVLKRLATALRDGDAERIRAVMYAGNESETKMVSAMADMANAMAALQKAAVKQFGREAAKEVVGDTESTDAQSQSRIDAADVKIQGDTATVTMDDGEDAPVVLKRVGGQWKLPMSELSKGANPAALDERLAGLADQARLVRDLAEEIADGKYSNPVQAHEAWQSRAMQASMRKPTERKPAERGPNPRATTGAARTGGR